MNIGKSIKEFRKQAGINQNELSERAGITQTYLSQIETGNKISSMQTIEAIAFALNIPVAKIYISSISHDDLKEKNCDYSIFMLKQGKEFILKVL